MLWSLKSLTNSTWVVTIQNRARNAEVSSRLAGYANCVSEKFQGRETTRLSQSQFTFEYQ